MKIAYDAANSIEAHMIKNLLEQYEVPAYVQGEHLQSGAGELPMGGLIKVSVDNSNYIKAKEIIKNWETTEIPNKVVQTKLSNMPRKIKLATLISFGSLAALYQVRY